ncbi:hypothetical protein [Melghirimyces algeriensis]|uniref:Uncharacterized protein n=1 Tax=Melghirimyces algeriensis TaxID=910412 RepID=A0A521AE65_9BACL|nr:hypothetical protein [Melghirimyces algeriensis]SMO33089.1 hypothetical protein SAMN06264849_10189 [Melghirimyces algeriensis]
MFQTKYGIHLVVALALLFFALSRLPLSMEWGISSLFTWTWLAFAGFIVAANWKMVLQVEREKRRTAERQRRNRWLKEQKRRKNLSWSARRRRGKW